MANVNRVTLIGNITRDIEIKYTPRGTATTELGLAINRTWKDDGGQKHEETTFVDVELWGRQAEIAGEHLKKGRSVFIEGRLKLDTWDDKQTGAKRSKLKVVAENMQFLGGKSEQSNGGKGGQSSARSASPATKKPAADPDLDTVEEDDVPF